MKSGFARVALVLSAALLLTAPAQAQQLGGGGGADISFVRIVAALLFSIGAAVALALLLRGRAASPLASVKWLNRLAPKRRIAVIEARRITQHSEMSIVQCGGIEYLLISGPGTVQVVERRELPNDPAEPA